MSGSNDSLNQPRDGHHASIIDGVFQSCTLEQVKGMHDDLCLRFEALEDKIVAAFIKDMDGWLQFSHDLEQLRADIQEYQELYKENISLIRSKDVVQGHPGE